MDDLLHTLETQIKLLLSQYDQAKKANLELNRGKSLLKQEQEWLMAKQHRTITQIEALISRLKAIERLS